MTADGSLRVAVMQPAVPRYRVAFFEAATRALGGTLTLFTPAPGASGSATFAENAPESDLARLSISAAGRYRPVLGGRLLVEEGWRRVFDDAPDVIVMHGNLRLVTNIRVLAEARRRRIGTVWWSHAGSHSSSGLANRLRHVVMRRADATLLYTDREREGLVASGFPEGDVFFTNNALDALAIDAAAALVSPEAVAAERRALSLDASEPVFLFVGRFTEKADLGLLVAAAGAMERRGQAGCFVLIGEGSARAPLEAAIVAAGVAGRFRFTGAIFDEDRLARHFAMATAFVYPGAVGLSILHGLYYGVPAVIHRDRRRHNPEADAFEEGANGVSFAPGDATSLADALHRIATDPDARDRMAQHARRETRRRFSIETMVSGFLGACRRAREKQAARR